MIVLIILVVLMIIFIIILVILAMTIWIPFGDHPLELERYKEY